MLDSGTLLALFSEGDLRPARRAVKQIAECLPFDSKQVAEITLAVSEACINGVRYSSPRDDEPVVIVIAERRDDHLSIEVKDQGEGFEQVAPAMPDPSAESGRGIALMHALMDQVAIVSGHGGTRVHMIKYFTR